MPENAVEDMGVYDYAIIGAGSAGCVLADRLSASGRYKVVVLEAGGNDSNIWIHVPLGYGKLFRMPSVNWMYETEPESELYGRRIFQPRGRVLGGSSSINGLVYIRGQREDFDLWRDLGNPGWGYEDVLPYFRKSEDFEGGAGIYHGKGGPLAVSGVRDTHPLCDAFISAGVQRGNPHNNDFNAATQEGIGYYHSTTRNGVRCSTARAFLRPARNRGNLHVVIRAHASRILFEGRRATGVEFRHEGRRKRITVAREILLSAGSINSPQLLELSGWGNPQHIRSQGIEMIANAPEVGEGLQDHLQVRMVFRSKRKITLNDQLRNPVRRVGVGLDYIIRRRGPLTVAAGYAGWFMRADPAAATPDVQIHFILFSTDKMGTKLNDFPGFTASVCQLRPESRGDVHIQSPDPFQPPSIRVNYLASEVDRHVTVEGLKRLRDVMHAPAMEKYLDAEIVPGPDIVSDEALLDYSRRNAVTIYHPVGTCRMGSNETSVVTPTLKLRGAEGIRVVDGSVMPRLLSGNCNAGIIMIGEKAADMILADAM